MTQGRATPQAALPAETLTDHIRGGLDKQIVEPVRAYARQLASASGAAAVLFYGSNLRTGSLDGVLDFYVLLDGPRERGIWPRVSYHEWRHGNLTLRAKVATMTLAMFAAAARGETSDTTIWARFVQPAALAWARDRTAAESVVAALASAAMTAGRLAAALGPGKGTAADFWRALFRATYAAEFRVEKGGREDAIIAADPGHYAKLLPLAWAAAGIGCTREGELLHPRQAPTERARWHKKWRRWRALGKPLNLMRLIRATRTFEGAARYAAWKVERHTGVPVEVTPWRERHPILAAPGVLWRVWRTRRQQA